LANLDKNTIEVSCPHGHPVEFVTKGIVYCKYCVDKREFGYYYSLSSGVHYDYDKIKDLDKPLFNTPKLCISDKSGRKYVKEHFVASKGYRSLEDKIADYGRGLEID
jgi:hypothetical protein